VKRAALLTLLAGCGAARPEPQARPLPPSPEVADVATIADAGIADGVFVVSAAHSTGGSSGEVWLKGSTHVHARPSGDSSEPISSVIEWYESRGYDFIALTDHNKVSEVDDDTRGKPYVRAPAQGLIVLAGVELTHNPVGCLPPGDSTRQCRIHVNALGVTERPEGKIEWAERRSKQRVDMYQAALNETRRLGGALAQINHPNYHWGMTPEVLLEVTRRGAQLVEIANVQFDKWNAGDADHLSTEAQWDAVLVQGATLWGVASDDAHDYGKHGGKYPPGGGWVVVKARRDPRAILDALAAGRFYASTGVVLARAEVDGEELVVEVPPTGEAQHTITFIENGRAVLTVRELTGRRVIPRTGYVRAVVTRDDGRQAWVQPARR
jgi:hypothetical protein